MRLTRWYAPLMSPRPAALVALGVLLAACGESTLGPPTGGEPTTASIWNASSKSIDVSCFGYWIGSTRFVARRDQLSAAQLDMLSNLKVIDPTGAGCAEDGIGCGLSVGQGDGSTTTMDAFQLDFVCGEPRKIVSFESFEPFRQSLGCKYAKGSGSIVTADERCFNGLFTSGQGDPISVGLQIGDTTRTHHIELVECAQPGRIGKLSFSLLDSDGTTVLGSSSVPADPGANGTCAALELTFPHPGTFDLQIATEAGLLPAGDLYLRLY